VCPDILIGILDGISDPVKLASAGLIDLGHMDVHTRKEADNTAPGDTLRRWPDLAKMYRGPARGSDR